MTSAVSSQSILAERAAAIAEDPRMPATVRIGAIGHRAIDPAMRAEIESAVEQLLVSMQRHIQDALAQPRTRNQFVGDADMVLISPLAEGADRMVAASAAKKGYRLGAILPFAIPDYEASFDLGDPGGAVREFRDLLAACALPKGYGVFVLDGDPGNDRRDQAFMNCAKMIMKWSDVLVAVLSPQRVTSQSWISMQEAIDDGVPVIAIDPAEPTRPRLWVDGEIVDERKFETALRDAVVKLVVPSASQPCLKSSDRWLQRYVSEHVVAVGFDGEDLDRISPYRTRTVAPSVLCWISGVNRFFARWIRPVLSWRDIAKRQNKAAPVRLSSLGMDRQDSQPIADLIFRFCRADALAGAYAELYRSAQIVIVFLTLATVFFAALSPQNPFGRVISAGFELFCLTGAFFIIAYAQAQGWLGRWINYRLIAEVLRYNRFLLLAGQPSPFVDLRTRFESEGGERSWARDHVQYVLRAQPMTVPGRGVQTDPDAQDKIKQYILSQCIDDQIGYHSRMEPVRRRLASFLKLLAVVATVVTLIVVAVKFGFAVIEWSNIAVCPFLASVMATWWGPVHVLAIVTPAVTAGIFAIRANGEYEIVARRSLLMIANLCSERKSFDRSQDIIRMGESCLRIVRLLLREVDGWRDVFADKQLE